MDESRPRDICNAHSQAGSSTHSRSAVTLNEQTVLPMGRGGVLEGVNANSAAIAAARAARVLSVGKPVVTGFTG
jgi:hypothetical protein